MSTDYGFKCRECEVSVVIDNLRRDGIDTLKGVLSNLDAISIVIGIGNGSYPGVIIALDGSYFARFQEAVGMAIKHRGLGHTVVVCDEYGREWDQCGDYWKCPTCKHCESCTLKEGHEGEHKPKRSA